MLYQYLILLLLAILLTLIGIYGPKWFDRF